jgi:NAD(P)H-flavin reductase
VEQEKQFMTSRILRVARKVQETSNTLSVYLAAADAKPLQPFNAGQFLEFEIPDVGVRAYLLSAFSAQPKIYRITVKHRPGNEDLAASGATYWRRTAAQGDAVKAYGPTGSFGLRQPLERPVVLIAAAAGEASLSDCRAACRPRAAPSGMVRASNHQQFHLRTEGQARFASCRPSQCQMVDLVPRSPAGRQEGQGL